MNRSCNSILCRFGIHTADPYVHIQVKCRNGSHRWQSNYEICKRCGKRTEEKDWNCLDMVLDNEQAKQLADYAVKKEVYNWDGVESVVATALMHENKVVINANW